MYNKLFSKKALEEFSKQYLEDLNPKEKIRDLEIERPVGTYRDLSTLTSGSFSDNVSKLYTNYGNNTLGVEKAGAEKKPDVPKLKDVPFDYKEPLKYPGTAAIGSGNVTPTSQNKWGVRENKGNVSLDFQTGGEKNRGVETFDMPRGIFEKLVEARLTGGNPLDIVKGMEGGDATNAVAAVQKYYDRASASGLLGQGNELHITPENMSGDFGKYKREQLANALGGYTGMATNKIYNNPEYGRFVDYLSGKNPSIEGLNLKNLFGYNTDTSSVGAHQGSIVDYLSKMKEDLGGMGFNFGEGSKANIRNIWSNADKSIVAEEQDRINNIKRQVWGESMGPEKTLSDYGVNSSKENNYER